MPDSNRLTRRSLLAAAPVFFSAASRAGAFRLAVFRADATPDPGEPLIWTVPLTKVEDPLWAKGLVLEQAGRRLVLCTLDWCGLGGEAFGRIRQALASAAGATPADVILHTVHQHAAPYLDGDAYRLLRELPNPPLMYSRSGLERLSARLAAALKRSLDRLRPVEAVGLSQARVERVASSRRVWDQGKLVVRYSTSGKDPYQAALPEGRIDPWLKTITFAAGREPLARLHFYATHPQTFCCDGRASADFVGQARETFEREEGVFQLYLTGCAGDVTVGKYNDGSERARRELAERLLAALKASAAAADFRPAAGVRWRTVPLRLPARAPDNRIEEGADPTARYRIACRLAYARRREPLWLTAVDLGAARILHLPGEPLLEFQQYAQSLDAARFTAVAGYGDIGPGYICPDRALEEGGYEPSASHLAPGAESLLKRAIAGLLAS
jgi:hypothetical protein